MFISAHFHFLLGIYINIIGKAYCYWTEGMGDNKKIHTGEDLYLVKRIYLVGDADGEFCVIFNAFNAQYVPPEQYGMLNIFFAICLRQS